MEAVEVGSDWGDVACRFGYRGFKGVEWEVAGEWKACQEIKLICVYKII